MTKLTLDRVAGGLCLFLAGLALGGTGLLATPVKKQGAEHPTPSCAHPLFFYDLENNRHHGRDPLGQLRLVLEPVRAGKAGLLVRIEVWNPSIEAKRVLPIWPSAYWLYFRDAAGRPAEVYTLQPPGTPAIPNESELPLIDYGNCLSASYVLPTYYQRIKKNLECRVEAHSPYNLDSKGNSGHFDLSSDWVKVPPP